MMDMSAGVGHTDVVHAVEADHNGTEASSVLYIPAVPLTERKSVAICRPLGPRRCR